MIESPVRELRQRLPHDPCELLRARRLRLTDHDAEERLKDIALVVRIHIAAKPRIDECLPQRRTLHPQQRVIENLQRHDALHVRRIADHPAKREKGILCERLLRADGIEMILADARRECSLTINTRRHGNAVKMRKVGTVEIRQLLLDVKIAIEIDITVGRMIVARMEGKELLLRQRGNRLGIAARLIAVCRIGIECRHDAAAEEIIRRRECALHLIVDHPAVRQRGICILKLVMPPLLHEHLRILTHRWVKHRIQIDIHQILKIAVIAACHGVHRLIGERHRIEERIERALHELHERLLQRILARAAEHGVLHDMRHPRIIDRRRAEADRKHLVVVCRLQKEQLRPRLLMHERVCRPLCLCNPLRAKQAKTVNHIIYFHEMYPPYRYACHYTIEREILKICILAITCRMR